MMDDQGRDEALLGAIREINKAHIEDRTVPHIEDFTKEHRLLIPDGLLPEYPAVDGVTGLEDEGG